MKERARAGLSRQKPDLQDPVPIRWVMKRKVDQGETQRAYVHALSDSGSHIREKERRPGRTPKRFETA